jgi:hypothetical protein
VKPKTKMVTLTLSLALPYMALVLYFVVRNQGRPLPIWFGYFCLSYMLVAMIVIAVFSRKIYRQASPETVVKPVSAKQWMARVWTGYLIAVWTGLFLWGAYQTILGNLDWRRTVPAAAFLLAFIALFSWSLYKDIQHPTQPMTPGDPNTAQK